ncbi:unnamed protein product [Effrenium voratum]|uniref:Uncharacterized protein n=1 Tax=Effrenium voratum TaxID=2562239 RepID=A0AA36I279_9DINO|nr:unnamed protein product [Effrenium voratum]CAJ1425417.1 unnamed protein product [Effrenium voratum]
MRKRLCDVRCVSLEACLASCAEGLRLLRKETRGVVTKATSRPAALDWEAWEVGEETPVTLKEMSNCLATPGSVSTASGLGSAPGSGLRIPAGCSLAEGMRMLLLHHLRRLAGVGDEPSGQQRELERHLAQLASYSEKLLACLRAVSTAPSAPPEPAASPAASSARSAASGPGASAGAAGRAARPVRLRDSELLEIYRCAQQEASREADWRGV